MKILRCNHKRQARGIRGGAATVELLFTTGTLFIFTVMLYKLAVMSCHNLYHVIGSMVGSPYL